MTNVIFYKESDGEILAYFPDIIGDSEGNKTCYVHIGQHSACHPDYVKDLQRATPDEYKDLYNELVNQGYKDLKVKPLTTKQYLKLHPEKYVMVTHEFGNPVYVAPCKNLRTQVTPVKSEAEIWSSIDFGNPIKLDMAKIETGYKGLNWELL